MPNLVTTVHDYPIAPKLRVSVSRCYFQSASSFLGSRHFVLLICHLDNHSHEQRPNQKTANNEQIEWSDVDQRLNAPRRSRSGPRSMKFQRCLCPEIRRA